MSEGAQTMVFASKGKTKYLFPFQEVLEWFGSWCNDAKKIPCLKVFPDKTSIYFVLYDKSGDKELKCQML